MSPEFQKKKQKKLGGETIQRNNIPNFSVIKRGKFTNTRS